MIDRRLLAIIPVIIILMLPSLFSDEADAAIIGSGTEDNPYTELIGTMGSSSAGAELTVSGNYYFVSGTVVDLDFIWDDDFTYINTTASGGEGLTVTTDNVSGVATEDFKIWSTGSILPDLYLNFHVVLPEDEEYTYTLSFNANGGSGAPSTMSYGPTTDTSHTFTIPSTMPYRSGYTFAGWGLTSTASSGIQPGDPVYLQAPDTTETLYAIWDENPHTYTLSFNANGGSGAPSTMSYGPTTFSSYTFTIPNTVPTYEGHYFLGWSPSGSSTLYDPGDRYTVRSSDPDVTLYAQWEELDQYTYTITYDYNWITIPRTSTDSYGPTTDTSHTFTIPSNLPPDRTGAICTGWSTEPNGDVEYQIGGSITLYSTDYDVTLYAVWTGAFNYTLTYNANGGSGAPPQQSATGQFLDEYEFTISGTEPTRAGFLFLGWSRSSSADSPSYYPNGTIEVTNVDPDVTLYAVWGTSYTYTLTYNANGGSGAPSPQTYDQTTEISHTFTISDTEPTLEGSEFLGWSTSPSADEAGYQPGGSITLYALDPDVTLYAVWGTYFTFTLSFNANGGSGAPSMMSYGPTLDLEHSFTIPSDIPVFDSHEFLGWSRAASGSATYQPGGTITLDRNDENPTLYAVWENYVVPTVITINLSGSTSAGVGETRTITAVVLPSDLDDRGVTWMVTFGSELISYDVTQTWRGSELSYQALGAGVVTIMATANADAAVTSTITIEISEKSVEDSEVIGPQGIVGALGDVLFGGSSSIAGVVLFAIILAVLFAIIREPLPVVLLGIPVLAIFTLLGILDMDMVILLIIVVTVGLALIARKMWRD